MAMKEIHECRVMDTKNPLENGLFSSFKMVTLLLNRGYDSTAKQWVERVDLRLALVGVKVFLAGTQISKICCCCRRNKES